MGVTIHYQGRLKKDVERDFVINLARQFAEVYRMEYHIREEENSLFERWLGTEEWNYYSSSKMIIINPGERAEALIFDFDDDGFIQWFCKTQFAEIEVHIRIIQLLRLMEPYFEELDVMDEGEYWDTGDASILEAKRNEIFRAIEIVAQHLESGGGLESLGDLL